MTCTVQNGAELGALGDEYNKSPYREGSPRLLKDKTHRPTSPSGIFSRLFFLFRCACVIGSWGRMDSRGYSRTMSFVFEQSGAPFPARGLIILVTRCPSSAPFWTVQGSITTVSCRHFGRRVYLATGFDFREKKSVCFGSIGVQVRLQPPTLPLYYEGKAMKTNFPQNYVYVLRTTRTSHMVSFIDYYFHFLANFPT